MMCSAIFLDDRGFVRIQTGTRLSAAQEDHFLASRLGGTGTKVRTPVKNAADWLTTQSVPAEACLRAEDLAALATGPAELAKPSGYVEIGLRAKCAKSSFYDSYTAALR